MNRILKSTAIITGSMLMVFLIANGLAYWYECFKPMCNWGLETKQHVVWFTITTGLIFGAVNTGKFLNEIAK